jgi:hypothetical protein
MNARLLPRLLWFLLPLSLASPAYSQSDIDIWKNFIGTLKAGKMPDDRIRPLPELGDKYKPILLGFLDSVRAQASGEDWSAQPEIVRVGNRIQFIVPWGVPERKVTYCFSFLSESARWYFQHLEAIFIRLDRITDLPASTFPDVSEEMKVWAREEIYRSFDVLNCYLPLARERGKEAALSMLKDGAGYFVGARTWVPFSPPHKAFILYLCWEQAKLRGNKVTLVRLDDDEAIVQLSTHFFALYSTASHLKPVISLADYTSIFETIWQDRALNAGWRLRIVFSADHQATFHFRRDM